MAQTTVLAAAQTAAVSSDIVVPAGSQVSVSIFAAAGIPAGVRCSLLMKTPSKPERIAALTSINPSTLITGPGTFVVTRPLITAFGVNVGAFTES